jgi:hypothetical protein
MNRLPPLDQKPADYRFGGNCGVLSVAMCANVSFAVAEKACKLSSRSKGGTNHYQREQALKALGVRFESKLVMVKVGNGAYCKYVQPTIRTFVRDHTAPGVTYMLRVNKHVVTVRDGIVMDQQSVKPAAEHWSRNMRVTRVTKILEA